jgi:hypothetical protein
LFQKIHLDTLLNELTRAWQGTPDFEQLVRDMHLGIALSDAGSPIGNDIDPRVAALIEKHKPNS